jgi:hypothetical protein
MLNIIDTKPTVPASPETESATALADKPNNPIETDQATIDWIVDTEALACAKRIRQLGGMAYCRVSRVFYTYQEGGGWAKITPKELELRIPNTQGLNFARAIVRHLKSVLRPWNPYSNYWIFATEKDRNEVAEMGYLKVPHSRKYHFNYTLPEPSAIPTPKFQRLLQESVSPEDSGLLQTYAGCLLGGANRAAALIVQLGAAPVTKPLITDLLSRLVGKQNTHSIEEQALYNAKQPPGYLITLGKASPDIFQMKGQIAFNKLTGAMNKLFPPTHKTHPYHMIINAERVTPQYRLGIKSSLKLLAITYKATTVPTSSFADAETIWNEEGPGIVNWALNGHFKLANNAKFMLTPAQKALADTLFRPDLRGEADPAPQILVK